MFSEAGIPFASSSLFPSGPSQPCTEVQPDNCIGLLTGPPPSNPTPPTPLTAAKLIFRTSLSYSKFLSTFLLPVRSLRLPIRASTNLFSGGCVYVPQIFLFNLTSTPSVAMDDLQNLKIHIELSTLSTAGPLPKSFSLLGIRVLFLFSAPDSPQLVSITHLTVVLWPSSSCVDHADGMGPLSCIYVCTDLMFSARLRAP